MNQVIVAAIISNDFKLALEELGYELIMIESSLFISNDLITKKNCRFDVVSGIITSNKWTLDKRTLTQFPNLRWIARLGSGMEIIDTAYCVSQGIHYFSSPEGIANSVAEHMMGMLLALQHNIHSSYNEVLKGQWIREPNRGVELENKTVGIIGYGHTGYAFAKKLAAFTKHILVFDKYKKQIPNEDVVRVSLDEILEQSDIISFHVPLNDETRNYYNDDFMLRMKKPHVLVNSSRGAVVDTQAVLKHLQSGKVTGACLDVLNEEYEIKDLLLKENNIVAQLLQYNVLITPHIAGYSHEAILKMSQELLNQIKTI